MGGVAAVAPKGGPFYFICGGRAVVALGCNMRVVHSLAVLLLGRRCVPCTACCGHALAALHPLCSAHTGPRCTARSCRLLTWACLCCACCADRQGH